MPSPLITLTTDFGTSDPYVGVMKGVILGINPQATIVDLCHEIQPQAILQGAFLLGHGYRFFPEGSIHVAVVDPGVGTSRRPTLLATSQHYFVAPDNGLLSYIIKEECTRAGTPYQGNKAPLPPGFRAYQLSAERYWLHPVSATFHGRDVFAPVAAHLSCGVSPTELGEKIEDLTVLPLQEHTWRHGVLKGTIMHIDRFGNLVSDIPTELLAAPGLRIQVKGHTIDGLSPSYEKGGDLLSIIGSYHTLEIAVDKGNAALRLGAQIGDSVTITRPG